MKTKPCQSAGTRHTTLDPLSSLKRPLQPGRSHTPRGQQPLLRPPLTHGLGRHDDRNTASHHSNSDHGRLGTQYHHSHPPTNAPNALAPSVHHDLPCLAPITTMPLPRNTNTVLFCGTFRHPVHPQRPQNAPTTQYLVARSQQPWPSIPTHRPAASHQPQLADL
jgi:hypothetical protein